MAERERKIVRDELNRVNLRPTGRSKKGRLFRDIFAPWLSEPLDKLCDKYPTANVAKICRRWSHQLWTLSMLYQVIGEEKVYWLDLRNNTKYETRDIQMTHTYIQFGDYRLRWEPMRCWFISMGAALEKLGVISGDKHIEMKKRYINRMYEKHENTFQKLKIKPEQLKLPRPDFLIDKEDGTMVGIVNCAYEKPNKSILRKFVNHSLLLKPEISILAVQGEQGLNVNDISILDESISDTNVIQITNFDIGAKERCLKTLKDILSKRLSEK